MSPSSSSRTLALASFVAIAGLMWACGSDNATVSNLTTPEIPAAVADSGSVEAASNPTNPEDYCTFEVRPRNFSPDQDGNIWRLINEPLKVFLSRTPDHKGTVHFAAWDRSKNPQELLAVKTDTFEAGDQGFPLTVELPPGVFCDIQYDVAIGDVPNGANYDGRKLCMAYYGSTVGCEPKGTPEPTPTPGATPTPICNQGGDLRFSSLTPCDPIPTPTPTPRSTPTPTGTPAITPTPSPSPTGTPGPTPTPTPSPTSTPPPTSTPTPRPSPTPACSPLTNLPLAFLIGPFTSSSGISGSATFINTGSWDFNISATSTLAKCNARQWDHPNKVHIHKDLACGDSHTTGNLSYPWAGHGSEYWRLTIRLNGNVYAETTCVTNPYN